MATFDSSLEVVIEQSDGYEASAVDDGDELSDKKHDENAQSPTGVFATNIDYVEERYKVDRRKLEQMIQGKRKQTRVIMQFSVA